MDVEILGYLGGDYGYCAPAVFKGEREYYVMTSAGVRWKEGKFFAVYQKCEYPSLEQLMQAFESISEKLTDQEIRYVRTNETFGYRISLEEYNHAITEHHMNN